MVADPPARPRRVLMTADTVGGVWTYALELSRALGRHGVAIGLATMGAPPTAEQRRAASSLGNVELFESRFRLEWMDDPWADVDRAGDWLLDLADAFEPDLVHLNGYAHAALPWGVPTLAVGHSCVLSWWHAVRREPAPPEWGRYAGAVRRGLHAADLVLAPSRAMRDALQFHYGPLAMTGVIPNARDAADFPPGDKEPFILSAGRLWDEAKNLRALAEVAPGLSWPVHVAGEVDHPEGGRAVAANVRPLGRLDTRELAGWYGRASIYALPARYEPFGLSALEAALAGCALVLGDIPSLREVWGHAAVYVAPDDHEALADALSRLIAHEHLREERAALARARALEFAPDRMALAYLDAYRSLLEHANLANQPRPTEDARRPCVS